MFYHNSKIVIAEEIWKPSDLSVFLFTVFFIASPIAAVGGASVYSFLLTSETSFLTYWRLWWIGDATGLIILTPLLHMLFNAGQIWRMARIRYLELFATWVLSFVACYLVFSWELHSEDYLALTPLAVILAPIWVAIRFGPFAASFLTASVALYAAFATAGGSSPFIREIEASRSDRSRRPFSVMLLDIDHFKLINDRYGHDVGDQCLRAFAQAIGKVLRSVDRFGRWGGEEFIIIVRDSDHVDLVRLSEKLLDSTRNVVVPVENQIITFTVSIGVAEWRGTSFDKLVSEADDALYRAKEQGRDRAVFSSVARGV